MAANHSIRVRIGGRLRAHLQQQIGENGLYENASEYIRSLIRRDMSSRDEAWGWLKKQLEPGLRSDESEFNEVSAEDVSRRNN